MENSIRPFFQQNIEMYVHRNQIIEIDEHEFYVKYSRPFFGKICNGTEVKIESTIPKEV